MLAFANVAHAEEISYACPETVNYSIALKAPSAEWKVETEDRFTAPFADIHLYDLTLEKRKLLIPENGDAPAEKKLPLVWKLDTVKAPWMECQYKAADGAPGMGASLGKAIAAPLKSCTASVTATGSGHELRCAK